MNSGWEWGIVNINPQYFTHEEMLSVAVEVIVQVYDKYQITLEKQ